MDYLQNFISYLRIIDPNGDYSGAIAASLGSIAAIGAVAQVVYERIRDRKYPGSGENKLEREAKQ